MTVATFSLAVLALLLAPGPTNTLIGVAGAEGGLRRVVGLIPAEVLAYGMAVLALAFLGAGLSAQWPMLALIAQVCAAVWVLVLAVGLWRAPLKPSSAGVGPRQVFVTTMLNPKAAVFALVLLPPPHSDGFAGRLFLLLALVTLVALAWGCAGALLRSPSGWASSRIVAVRRVSSVWLAVLAVTMFAGLFHA